MLTAVQDNGGGLFTKEMDSHAAKAIWDFEGIYATSRHSKRADPAVQSATSILLIAVWSIQFPALGLQGFPILV